MTDVIERLLGMSYEDASPTPASAPTAPIWCSPAAPFSRRSAASSLPRLRVADRGLREGILVR